jgi:hypothetical protein
MQWSFVQEPLSFARPIKCVMHSNVIAIQIIQFPQHRFREAASPRASMGKQFFKVALAILWIGPDSTDEIGDPRELCGKHMRPNRFGK